MFTTYRCLPLSRGKRKSSSKPQTGKKGPPPLGASSPPFPSIVSVSRAMVEVAIADRLDLSLLPLRRHRLRVPLLSELELGQRQDGPEGEHRAAQVQDVPPEVQLPHHP